MHLTLSLDNGNIKFFDKHLSMFPVDLMYGFYTKHKANNKLDVAIVEATAITEDGGIIPGASVGASPEIVGRDRHSRQSCALTCTYRFKWLRRSSSKSTRPRRRMRACTTLR